MVSVLAEIGKLCAQLGNQGVGMGVGLCVLRHCLGRCLGKWKHAVQLYGLDRPCAPAVALAGNLARLDGAAVAVIPRG